MTDETTPVADAPLTEEEPEMKPSRTSRIRARLSTIGRGSVIALLVGLVLGAAGGFAVGALTAGDESHGDRDGMHGRPFEESEEPGGQDDRGFAPPPGGAPGGLPPTTAPDQSSSELNG